MSEVTNSGILNSEEPANQSERSFERKTILVVGDWSIQEHWVTVTQRQQDVHKMHPDVKRALMGHEGNLPSLGGAGRTAAAIYRAATTPKVSLPTEDWISSMPAQLQDRVLNRPFDLLCMGAWKHGKLEDNALGWMLAPGAYQERNHHRLAWSRQKVGHGFGGMKNLENLGITMLNLASQNSQAGTTYSYKIYRKHQGKLDLTDRVDWVLPWKTNTSITVIDQMLSSDRIRQKIDQISSVVVYDQSNGVVTHDLIKKLIDIVPKEAEWFVSTKSSAPLDYFLKYKANAEKLNDESQCSEVEQKIMNGNWLHLLGARKKIKLLIIPPASAHEAVRQGHINSWINAQNMVSGTAFKALETMNRIADTVVALPGGMHMLISANKRCTAQKERVEKEAVLDAPLDSLLLAHIASRMTFSVNDIGLRKPETSVSANSSNNIVEICKESLEFVSSWRVYQNQKLLQYPRSGINTQEHEPRIELNGIEPTNKNAEKFPPFKAYWSKNIDALNAAREWEIAFKGLCCVDRARKTIFQLWRAQTEIKEYVCVTKQKRKGITNLLLAIEEFKVNKGEATLNVMLSADPGSGKTYLIKKLAQQAGLHPLMFNITQMLSKADILDAFDTVVTTRQQVKDKPLLVFFDEINAKILQEPVYGTFLPALEEGEFIKEGKTYKLPPVIWIFAGTESLLSGSPETKSKDLASRINLYINLQPEYQSVFAEYRNLTGSTNEDSTKTLTGLWHKASPNDLKFTMDAFKLLAEGGITEATGGPIESEDNYILRLTDSIRDKKAENVYIGVSRLEALFPDIEEISLPTLFLLRTLKYDLSIRDVKKFCSNFRNIQDGKVTAANLPSPPSRDFFEQFFEIPDLSFEDFSSVWQALLQYEKDDSRKMSAFIERKP